MTQAFHETPFVPMSAGTLRRSEARCKGPVPASTLTARPDSSQSVGCSIASRPTGISPRALKPTTAFPSNRTLLSASHKDETRGASLGVIGEVVTAPVEALERREH